LTTVPHLAALLPLSGPLEWWRGPARFRDGQVELEPGAGVYEPYADGVDELPFALAGIHAPADAVAFAERFGLLRTGPGAGAYREPFSDWKQLASALRDAFALYSAGRAARKGDAAAEETIRTIIRSRERIHPELRPELERYAGLLTKAEFVVVSILSSGLRDVRSHLQPASLVEYPDENGVRRSGEPGAFLFAPECRTLAELAFLMAALTVSTKVDVRICPLCSRVFVPKQGQTYCEPKHTNAAKQRRHRARQTR
jgi:hypothetical protein